MTEAHLTSPVCGTPASSQRPSTTANEAHGTHPGVLAGLKRIGNDLLGQPRDLLVLRLSVLMFVLHGGTGWRVEIPLTVVGGAMLLSTAMLRSRGMWLLVTSVLIVGNAPDWALIDNHKYLMVYWSVACTLAVANDTDAVLRRNGRVLVGLVFTCAVLWKLRTGQYANGEFLHMTLLLDSRFEVPVTWLAGLERSALVGNRLLLSAVSSAPSAALSVPLESNANVRLLALGLSYWTLAIEIVIAMALVLPTRWVGRRAAHLALMVFVATTYTLVPVTGFAFALVVLMFAHCEPSWRFTRGVYLALLALVELSRIPWQQMV